MNALSAEARRRSLTNDILSGARRLQRRAPGRAAAGVIVFDASTLVSAAIIRGSVPDRALHHAFKAYEVAVSDATLAELVAVWPDPNNASKPDK